MVTPFKAVSSGVKDAYNFFQSQLRINIECAFGVLVNRWGILRSPIPLNISLEKTTSLVRSLCLLHNWLIDEKDIENIPSSSPSDRLTIIARGGEIIESENSRLDRSLDGGDHYDDVTPTERIRIQRLLFAQPNSHHPREQMINKLKLLGIDSRPKPMGTTTTNN